MRGARRVTRAEEEEESAFISMTDMTVSFLFILMILLAFAATQMAPPLKPEVLVKEEALAKSDPPPRENPIEVYNAKAIAERYRLLQRIRDKIVATDKTLDVVVNGSRDALQFKGDGLFDRNADKPRNRAKLELIARILRDELACYVNGEGSTLPTGCNANLVVIDALQVEGHTDSDGTDAHNMELSARRGAAVYTVMVAAAPEILAFKNLRSQPILSVAGYGKGRPIRENNSDEAKDANRRIDLRLIMFSPTEEKFVPQNLSHLSSCCGRFTPTPPDDAAR